MKKLDESREWMVMLLGGIQPIPRKIGPSAVSSIGRVATRKSEHAETHESLLERDLFLLLDSDHRVERFAANAFSIPWSKDGRRLQKYTPDVLVKFTPDALSADPNLRHLIIEVKPSKVIAKNWNKFKPKWRAAVAFARKNHLKFQIANEKRIRTPYLENLKFLRRFRRENLLNTGDLNEYQCRIIELMARVKRGKIADVLEGLSICRLEQAQYLPWLWQLIYYDEITCDLNSPLNMNSLIWTGYDGL